MKGHVMGVQRTGTGTLIDPQYFLQPEPFALRTMLRRRAVDMDVRRVHAQQPWRRVREGDTLFVNGMPRYQARWPGTRRAALKRDAALGETFERGLWLFAAALFADRGLAHSGREVVGGLPGHFG